LFADLDIHEVLPSGFVLLCSGKFAARYRCNIAQSVGVSSSGVRRLRFDRVRQACA
jgi:hypothetical protein